MANPAHNVRHDCKPLWIAAGQPPIASCTAHYGETVGLTAATATGGAR